MIWEAPSSALASTFSEPASRATRVDATRQRALERSVRALGYVLVDEARLGQAAPYGSFDLAEVERAIFRLNPEIRPVEVHLALRQLCAIVERDLATGNELAHFALVNGLEGAPGCPRVRLVDFDDVSHNTFSFVVRHALGGPARPRVLGAVVMANGFPLAVVAENRADEPSIDQGIDRILDDQRLCDVPWTFGVSRVFHVAQLLVALQGRDARFGTTGTPRHSWSRWSTAYGDTEPNDGLELAEMQGLLDPESLLALIRDFVIFAPGEQELRKEIARSYQIRAVNRTMERVASARQPAARGGVIWHAPGSGRALTLALLARRVRRCLGTSAGEIVVVTDRNGVRARVASAFAAARLPEPVTVRGGPDLRKLLSMQAGQTALVGAEDFRAVILGSAAVSRRSEIFVLFDGFEGSDEARMSATTRQALPNACLVGFPKAPLVGRGKRDCGAFPHFGPYLHKYGFAESMHDGVTLPVVYESRTIGRKDRGGEPPTARELDAICADIMRHLTTKVRPRGLKGQVFVRLRSQAFAVQRALDNLGELESAALSNWERDSCERSALLSRFFDPSDPLGLLVVSGPTGVSAPIVGASYIVTKARNDGLLGVLPLSNQPGPQKSHGLVIDYRGDRASIDEALRSFLPEDVDGLVQDRGNEMTEPRSEVHVVLDSRTLRVRDSARPSVADAGSA
jgi:type I restriction enzyme R subunit